MKLGPRRSERMTERNGTTVHVHLRRGRPRVSFRPCADHRRKRLVDLDQDRSPSRLHAHFLSFAYLVAGIWRGEHGWGSTHHGRSSGGFERAA